jgi:hypothetical protein
MKKNLFLLIAIFVCTAMFEAQAQSDSVAVGKLQQFVRNIHVFNRLIPQEKVYLHFDNTGYVLGETIWFKAYTVNASSLLPDTLSGVLYVELLNEKGKLLETKKLKIENGQSHGEFHLNETDVEYFAGFYEIRAYTKAMLNFGAETIFSRVFPVFDEPRENGAYTENDLKADLHLNDALVIPLPNLRPKMKKQEKLHADFYPEGGNLVTGLTSNVAFKITDDKGRPVSVAGEIVNPQGEPLSTFVTEHAGMGCFSYTPDGENNRMKVIHDNNEYFFTLPESKTTGYVLQTRPFSMNALIIQIEKSRQTAHSPLGLSVLCRGEVLFFQAVELAEEPYMLKIPYDMMGNGVHQITLFDAKGEIFAERLVFISPKEQDQLRLEAVPDKTVYQPDELIRIDFSVVGEHSDKEAAFSLAVRDKEMMIHTRPSNIYTHLLLSSDLQGFIENPEDYFHPENPNLQARNLDLLMMVQGWKRYEWQTMAGIKPFKPLYNREKQMNIKGHVVGSEGKNIELQVFMEHEGKQRMDGVAQTDDKGEFSIYPEDFYGTWTLNLRSKGLSEANTKIRLDRWFSPLPKVYAYHETDWRTAAGLKQMRTETEDDPILKEIENDSIWAFRIKEVTIKEKKRREHKKKELIHPVGMEIDRAIDRGEKIPYSVHDYLVERDKLYSFGKTDSETGIEYSSNPFLIYSGGKMDPDGHDVYAEGYTFFYGRPQMANFFHFYGGKQKTFDRIIYQIGKRVYDVTVKELTAKRVIRDVQKIVISGERRKRQIVGFYIPIYIYPYKDYVMREMPGIRFTTFEGFSVPLDYFHNKIAADGIYRPKKYSHHRTLYWNPNIKTDEQGKASIRFYNNSFCRKIDISAEGMTKNGMPVAAR